MTRLALAVLLGSCHAGAGHQPSGARPEPGGASEPASAATQNAVELPQHAGACALRTTDAKDRSYPLRVYRRDASGRLLETNTFKGPHHAERDNQDWKERWSWPALSMTEHRFEQWSGQPGVSSEAPFTCESDSTAPEDGDLDGWERWHPQGLPLSYHARGLGLDRTLRCATNRWESRSTDGAAYRYAARSPETLRLSDPGCVWCFLSGVSADRFDVGVNGLMTPEDCEEVEGLAEARSSLDSNGIEEIRGDCDDGLAYETHESFSKTPPLQPLVFSGTPQWTTATLGADVVAEAQWDDDGLPTKARLPTCGTTLKWRYVRDDRGRIVSEHRTSAAGEDVWTIDWSGVHEDALAMMQYRGADGAEARILFDTHGNLASATLPGITEPGGFYSRASSDGTIVVDYDCGPPPPFTTADAWIDLLFELSVDPTVPEHNQLFPIPQFVYARLDPNAPVVAAGVWGTGRGPVSDLELTGRFSVPGCLPTDHRPPIPQSP